MRRRAEVAVENGRVDLDASVRDATFLVVTVRAWELQGCYDIGEGFKLLQDGGVDVVRS